MYVSEFLCGVFATIIFEVALLITVSLLKGGKKNG